MPAVFTSLLAQRLDAASALRVVEAEAGMALEPGTVHLAPGGERHMQVRRDGGAVRVALVDSPPEHSCRPAVDVLFRSIGSLYGARALAVVLTGMGFDGSGAAPALHAAGARILVQDEDSSVVWGMPGAIVRAGLADEILPLARDRTGARAPRVRPSAPGARRRLDPDRAVTAPWPSPRRSSSSSANSCARTPGSSSTPARSTWSRPDWPPSCASTGCRGSSELVSILRARPFDPLREAIKEAMTTNETSFFRDIHPFEALRTQILPELIKARAADRSLTMWCAAASSGQEPYSVMMLLRQHFPQLADWNIRFLCTDLSKEMIDRCQGGRYSQLEVNRGLPAPMLVKWFRARRCRLGGRRQAPRARSSSGR